MHALVYTSPEWQHANPTEKQAVCDWVNTLPLPAGHLINLLHTDGQVTVEYCWYDGDIRCLDVHACDATEPPPAFWLCSRRIDARSAACTHPSGPGAVDPRTGATTCTRCAPERDPLTEMGGAWRDLTWQMVLECGRRLRLWF